MKPSSQNKKINLCPNYLKKLKIYSKHVVSGPFSALLVKIGGSTATKVTQPKDIFAAPFELFCRIFGHLATGVYTGLSWNRELI